ncbi:putative CtpA-like serine protease [Phycisphaerales bacterium]|nr:putative CtpA-like serine protease [Phycisphaerales bacterium]
MPKSVRRWRPAAAFLAFAVLAGTPLTARSWAQADVQPVSHNGATVEISKRLWDAARSGDSQSFQTLLKKLAEDPQPGLRAAAAQLIQHFADRESTRQSRLVEVRADLDKALGEPQSDLSLSKSLRAAIELHTLTPDDAKKGILAEPKIADLVSRSDRAAKAAEERGDVIAAGELVVLLDLLLDTSGKYKPDVRRITQRQEMLRLYAPERMWELRNERNKAEGGKPLPPYNPFGDDWRIKLSDIDQHLIEQAIARSRQHVERRPVNEMVQGGLEAVRALVSTSDFRSVFPGLADDAARTEMLNFIDEQTTFLKDRPSQMETAQIDGLLRRLRSVNENSVRIDRVALLHEFGQGAMSRLDEFSEIIWPDEVRRFNKSTQGHFVGVGVQIEFDELQNIKVVSPIEGTPAQRAGIHPNDLIVRVDDRSIYGLSLDQVVDVITGPSGTNVKLTVERAEDAGEGAEPRKVNKDFMLKRSIIKVSSVRGWNREGVKEDSWDWFIDPENRIGYVRLTQFSDSTSFEFDRAISALKKGGAKSLIFDLRFDPGGLLDQAVRVAQRFIDAENDYIVMTQGPSGEIEQPEYTNPERASLAHMPIIVLVNEGSASASEIVSGAIATYAHRGQIDAMVLGARSYGKGSVQNVWPISATAMMKLTTAYYMLPNKSIIHRKPGSEKWGIEPDLKIEMLPKQTVDSLLFRRNADVIPMDENGMAKSNAPRANPEDLITKGTDIQLETALLLLRARTVSDTSVAQKNK